MPAIRRLLASAFLLVALAMPARAQTLAAASPDLLAVQAPQGAPSAASPPPVSAAPQQSRPAGEVPAVPAQSFPSRGGYQCERSRPTS